MDSPKSTNMDNQEVNNSIKVSITPKRDSVSSTKPREDNNGSPSESIKRNTMPASPKHEISLTKNRNNNLVENNEKKSSLTISSRGSMKSQKNYTLMQQAVNQKKNSATISPPAGNALLKSKISALVSNTKMHPADNILGDKFEPSKRNTLEMPTNPKIDITSENSGLINKLTHSDNVAEITNTMKNLAEDLNSLKQSPVTLDTIERISIMSKILTNEANALSDSIKHLAEDITKTKQCPSQEDVTSFPYHLFLMEIIINKINMKCECFEEYSNLVITCSFLGKTPMVLYSSSCGNIADFNKINVGKSSLFAMTYDKICSIEEFEIVLELQKQPPCSHCVTKLAETHMDYTKEFKCLRQDLCKRWSEEKPNDTIICTSSSPMQKRQFFLTCEDSDNCEPIGIIDVSLRMSFLGKQITTTFTATPKPKGNSYLRKEDNGISLYSCQNVEMDDCGKIILDEPTLYQPKNTIISKDLPYSRPTTNKKYQNNEMSKYDEIYTKMNSNELKIRVPKTNKIERMGYDKVYELCDCESNAYNGGEQIQLELPRDGNQTYNTYTSNLKYTYNGVNKNCEDKRIINVTPTNCPPCVSMEKMLYPGKDVFILKIGKKLETKDKKTDLEIELVTPQAHSDKSEHTNVAQQCASTSSVNPKPSKSSIKKKHDKSKDKGKKNKAGLGEFRIRDLNDEINKLMREKRHWELQIKSLGGPDHARVGPKMLDQDGKEVPGNRGYKYFGAAKDLPGVRELFEQEPPPPPRRTRADLMRDVDADYYGYRDDDDGLLLPLEKEAEEEAVARTVDEWKRNKDKDVPEEENIYPEDPDDKRIDEDDEEEMTSSFTSHVAVPTQKEIEEALLRRKKQELLEEFGCLDVKIEENWQIDKI